MVLDGAGVLHQDVILEIGNAKDAGAEEHDAQGRGVEADGVGEGLAGDGRG